MSSLSFSFNGIMLTTEKPLSLVNSVIFGPSVEITETIRWAFGGSTFGNQYNVYDEENKLTL